MKREMCIPCTIKLAETKDVKKIAHRREKITCSECGLRRYGSEHEVSRKAAGKNKAKRGQSHDTIPKQKI